MMAINIGTRRELFVDKHLVDTMENTELRLHEPIPMENSIKIDKPWEGGANFGNTVIKLDGRYLMYYRAMRTDDPENPHLCLAVSDDGIHWEKPVLQPEGTNFVESNNFFLDNGPAAAADGNRVRGFFSQGVDGSVHNAFGEGKGAKMGVFYTSKDGKVFEKMDPQPKMVSGLMNSFDGGDSVFWSEEEQQYVAYIRYSVLNVRDDKQNATGWQRSMSRFTSKDLYNWSEPVEMRYSDTPEQFYVNGTQPYFRAPHIYISLAARYMEEKRVLTKEQEAALGVYSATAHNSKGEIKTWYYADDCSDAVMMSTRAGSTVYDRTFMEAFVYPGLGHSHWVSRTNYPLDGGFHQLDDTTMSFYIHRNYMQPTWHIQRMQLRLDGMASLHAPWKGGVMTTKPIIFDGSELELNFRTSAAGWIRVELTDEDGNLLPGFNKECCDPIVGDEISKTVTWRSGYSLAKYAGTPVRLRFYMKDADIYSYKFN